MILHIHKDEPPFLHIGEVSKHGEDYVILSHADGIYPLTHAETSALIAQLTRSMAHLTDAELRSLGDEADARRTRDLQALAGAGSAAPLRRGQTERKDRR